MVPFAANLSKRPVIVQVAHIKELVIWKAVLAAHRNVRLDIVQLTK